jgi:hypothetical protein
LLLLLLLFEDDDDSSCIWRCSWRRSAIARRCWLHSSCGVFF